MKTAAIFVSYFSVVVIGVSVGFMMPTTPIGVRVARPAGPPPVETAVAQEIVGGIEAMPPIYIEAPKTSPLPPKPKPNPAHFFDFDHARCDRADSIHGRVLRCYR